LLPARLLARSRRARVRIRINDGFNETAKVSGRFTSLGAAPSVHIFSPMPGTRSSVAGTLFLEAIAFDDANHMLTGHALRWYVGRRMIAFGSPASYFGLGPGSHVIRLVATDRFGRHTTATVTIGLMGARTGFLLLKAPKQISRKARRVTLNVAALASSTLTVNGHSFTVGRRPSMVPLKIKPGRAPLVLTLRLTAGGPASTQVITINRR
jgi:hypothetical protein